MEALAIAGLVALGIYGYEKLKDSLTKTQRSVKDNGVLPTVRDALGYGEPEDVKEARIKREAEEKRRAATPEGRAALEQAVKDIDKAAEEGRPVLVDRGQGPKLEVSSKRRPCSKEITTDCEGTPEFPEEIPLTKTISDWWNS